MQEDNDEVFNRFDQMGFTTNLTKDDEENMGVNMLQN
jgi:hypothetical protein